MKIYKLMLTLAVAATAFNSCNKNETTPVDVTKSLKSVTLNLSNATFTKSATTDALKTNDVVTLNNMQVFFSDGTNLYQAYDATGNTPATTYFTAVPTGEAAQFHFLPNEVVEVIVIANHGQKDLGTADANKKFSTTKQQLLDGIKDLTVDAEQTQNAKNLPLYGIDSELAYSGEDHNTGDNAHNNPVYLAADVKLVPAVARFEVVGFQYAQVDENTERKYEQVEVEQLVFRNYNTAAVVNSFAGDATASGADANALATLTLGDGNIFTWFAEMLSEGWFADEPKCVLAKDGDYTWGMVPAVANVAPTSEYSYHVFPGTMIPEFDLKIKGNGTATLPTVPLYLKTSTLHVGAADGAALASIEAGNIYRMAMVFDDEDFENPEKCIDLTVEVAPWAVQILVPEF